MSDTIQTKRCTKCKQFKPIADFLPDNRRPDGYGSHCRDCNYEYVKAYRKTEKGKIVSQRSAIKYRKNHPKKYKESQKRYRHTAKGRKACYAVKQRQFLRNPNVEKARRAVRHAVRDGKLPAVHTLNCYRCNANAQEYHHHNGYEKTNWFDIKPVCKKCHRIIHKTLPIKCL